MHLRFLLSIAFLLALAVTAHAQPTKIGDKFKLGQAYEQSGDYRNAARVYQELYAANPASDQYFQGVVRALSSLQQFSSVLPIVQERLLKYPTLELHALEGQLLWRTGKTTDADKAWKAALDMSENNESAYEYIARTQTALRLTDKAIATLLLGRERIDRPTVFADELSQLYAAIGNYEQGTREVMTLFHAVKNSAIAQGRLSALMTTPKGREFVGSILDRESESGDYSVQKLYLWYLRESKNYDRALEISEKIDRSNNLQGRELLEFADITSRDNQYDIALKAFGKIIDRGKFSPHFQSALYGYARTLDNRLQSATALSVKDINDVIDRYRTIVAQFPNSQQSADCQYHIGLLAYERLGDYSLAEKEFKRLFENFQRFPIVAAGMVKLGELYIAQDKTPDAERIFGETVRLYSSTNQKEADKAAFLLAELEYYRGAIDSAQEHYALLAARTDADASNDALERITLIEQNKTSLDTLRKFAAAEFKERQKKYDEAIAQYQKVIEIAPESDLAEQSLLRCAQINFTRKSHEAGREFITKLLTKYPDSIYGDRAMLDLGNSYAADGNKDLAIQTFTDLLAKFPRSILLNEAREKIRKLRGDV